MATPAPHEGQHDIPRDNQHGDKTDNSDVEEENGPPRNIPVLYVPDLGNTILSEAIKDGIRIDKSSRKYIIHTLCLKDVVGIE